MKTVLYVFCIGLLLNSTPVQAEIGRCTKEVASRRSYAESGARILATYFDGIPKLGKLPPKASDALKRARARTLYQTYLKLGSNKIGPRYRPMCLKIGAGRSYIERVASLSSALDKRRTKIKERVEAGHNIKRNKIKVKELAECSKALNEEIIPRITDICEHARINIELERLAIKDLICRSLDPQHLVCS